MALTYMILKSFIMNKAFDNFVIALEMNYQFIS